MSIRWIRNVTVDGQQATLEVMLGDSKIADKCYVRLNRDVEFWFQPTANNRETILRQGIEMLKSRLRGKSIRSQNGSDFTWH